MIRSREDSVGLITLTPWRPVTHRPVYLPHAIVLTHERSSAVPMTTTCQLLTCNISWRHQYILWRHQYPETLVYWTLDPWNPGTLEHYPSFSISWTQKLCKAFIGTERNQTPPRLLVDKRRRKGFQKGWRKKKVNENVIYLQNQHRPWRQWLGLELFYGWVPHILSVQQLVTFLVEDVEPFVLGGASSPNLRNMLYINNKSLGFEHFTESMYHCRLLIQSLTRE